MRKNETGNSKIGVKRIDGTVYEELLENSINSDTYDGKEIVRVYSSGHVFLSSDFRKVFLVTTSRNDMVQHQFTGGSPLESENKNVIAIRNGQYSFDIGKVRGNARIRTLNRTGVRVLEEYNIHPLVDWVLMEDQEEGWRTYFKLVCLMHFIVKTYDGTLGFTGRENTIGADWYTIEDLPRLPNISPNAYVVSTQAVKLIS